MTGRFRARRILAGALAALLSPLAHAAETPLAGCYERIYDAGHLAAHRGQIIQRARVSIAGTSIAKSDAGDKQPLIAEATLRIWPRREKLSFDSLGVCWAEGADLVCNGSDSAAESDKCKSGKDGVRDCRIYDAAGSGSFRIAATANGVLVTIRERLELAQKPYDGVPFLYLSPGNAENHAFFLPKVPDSNCK